MSGVCIAAATTTVQFCGHVWQKITMNSDSSVKRKKLGMKSINKQTDLSRPQGQNRTLTIHHELCNFRM